MLPKSFRARPMTAIASAHFLSRLSRTLLAHMAAGGHHHTDSSPSFWRTG
jgi:hypothetical protein